MTLPNFLIIGAAKSGTSSLYMYLMQHPEIFMSPVKEPHFFSFDSESKMTTGPGDPIHEAITEFDEYQAQFDGVMGEKAIGEASTSYLYRPEAPQRIHAMLPNVKMIAILRNPADRAFSAYMHVVRERRETTKGFSEALSREAERKAAGWEPIWHFTSVGHYYEQLTRYYKLFHREQIKVVLYDELQRDQKQLIREIYQFLDVNPNFTPGSSARYNASGEINSDFVDRTSKWLISSPNPIRWFSRHVIPESWRMNFAAWIRLINLKKQDIPAQVRRELLECYQEEILQLQRLINKDLLPWLK